MSTVLHTATVHHTTFDKLAIRANFQFDPATPYLAYGQGLYVKTTSHTFAAVAKPQTRGQGDKVTNTGFTKYFTGARITIDSLTRRVIDPNPAFVHQEADKINW